MRRVFIASGIIAGLVVGQPGSSRRARPRRRTCPRSRTIRCRTSSSSRRTSISAKASASPPIPRGTSSSTREAATRACSSSIRTARYVREIGAGLYGFTFAHAVRVDKDDNIWTVDEGSNMVIKFNPAGRVVMVIGRRPDPVDELDGDDRPGIGAAPEQAVLVQPSDRRRLGRAGQHLRHRRLRRRPRREVRQERPLHQVGGQRAATARGS